MMWMLSLFALLLTWPTNLGTPPNPLFTELCTDGLSLGAAKTVKLPSPWMADGLDATRQAAVLAAVAGQHTPVDELVRASVVAPYILRITDLSESDPRRPGRAIDLAFVAYGDLDRLSRSDFLDHLLNSGRQDAKIQALGASEAGRRGLTTALPPGVNEGFAHVNLNLMDRVELSGTNRTVWTRTGESITVAAKLDPRMTNDPAFPNRWRTLRRDDEGRVVPEGAGHPFEEVGYYLKITQLREPADALFVEWHLIFAEPVEWFDGANLLRSKLPLVLQSKIRGFRRDLLRMK